MAHKLDKDIAEQIGCPWASGGVCGTERRIQNYLYRTNIFVPNFRSVASPTLTECYLSLKTTI